MIKFNVRYAKPLLALTAAATLAGCDIGDGNKIESISIDDSINTVRLDDCVGTRLTAIATFTDGSQVNFTDRVNWISEDTSVATITTRPTDRPATFDEDFGFLIPSDTASEGSTTNISIEYFGLTSETSLEVTTTGVLEEIGLSIHDSTMAVGTSQTVSAWGRSSSDERVDLTNAVEFSINDAAASQVSLDEDFNGAVTADAITTAPATLSAVYCRDSSIHEETITATIRVVEDTPDSLVLSAPDTSLAAGTLTEIRATALYSETGGFQGRRTSTFFSQSSPGDPAELIFTNSFNVSNVSVGNFRVTPSATSGTHEVLAQYVDLAGNNVAGATGTIDITLVNTQIQTPGYLLSEEQGQNILVGTNVELAIIGQFDELDDSGAIIGSHTQDVTDFSQLIYSDAEDVDKVVIGSGIALAVSAGTSEFTVNSSTDGFSETSDLTIVTHDDSGAVINSITVTAIPISHKVYRLRAVADITAGGISFNQDISLNTAWQTSDIDVLHVDNSAAQVFGVAIGGAAGCATITAHFKGVTGSAVLNSATGEPGGCP